MSGKVTPLPPEDWDTSIAHLGDGFAGQLNVYRVMAHHPALLEHWAPLRRHVVLENALGEERLEIVILRVATRLGSHYEWTHHVARATRLGLDADRIRSVAGDPSDMTGEDGLLAEAVDAVIDRTRLDDALLERLTGLVGTAGVLDLMATVGFYKTLGAIAETFGIVPDEIA